MVVVTSATRAATALDVLEDVARNLEEANRYGAQMLRTAEHMIDPTKLHYSHTKGRITLSVAMLYPPFFEKLAYYGNRTALESRKTKAHLAYAVWYEGTFLPLTRDEAVELLATRELPAGVALPVETPSVTPEEIDALFEELAKPSIHADLGGAKRATRLRREAGQY